MVGFRIVRWFGRWVGGCSVVWCRVREATDAQQLRNESSVWRVFFSSHRVTVASVRQLRVRRTYTATLYTHFEHCAHSKHARNFIRFIVTFMIQCACRRARVFRLNIIAFAHALRCYAALFDFVCVMCKGGAPANRAAATTTRACQAEADRHEIGRHWRRRYSAPCITF